MSTIREQRCLGIIFQAEGLGEEMFEIIRDLIQAANPRSR
jgi:hypothetical protein